MKKWLSALLAALMILMMPLATMEEAMEIIVEAPEEAIVEEVIAPEEEDIEVVPAPIEEAEYEEEDVEVVAAPVEEEIFQIEDGVLVAYNGTDETVEIPDGVVTIAAWAFAGNNIVKKVVCPDSVESIEDFAFYGCGALEAIAYGETTEAGAFAFEGCEKLTAEEAPEEEIVEEPVVEEEPVAEEETIPEETEAEETEAETEEEETAEEAAEQEEDTEEEIIDRQSRATLSITTQPVDVKAALGATAKFTVKATNVKSYQWEYSTNGTKWYNCAAAQGGQTATFTTTATEARYGFVYRCVLTDANSKEYYTNQVKIIDPDAIEITTQPVDVKAALGATAKFTVKATNVKSYQWEYSTNGTKWYNCAAAQGGQTATFTTTATEARYGFVYRCVLTNVAGTEYYTDQVSIINPYIVINNVYYEPITASTCRVKTYNGSASSLVIPQTVKSEDGGTFTVTEIGVEAFMDNKSLKVIDLPDTITVIKARAFKNCTSLTTMK